MQQKPIYWECQASLSHSNWCCTGDCKMLTLLSWILLETLWHYPFCCLEQCTLSILANSFMQLFIHLNVPIWYGGCPWCSEPFNAKSNLIRQILVFRKTAFKNRLIFSWIHNCIKLEFYIFWSSALILCMFPCDVDCSFALI